MKTPPESQTADDAWQRWQLAVVESTPDRPLCLALANTRDWRQSSAPREHLATCAELARWARAQGLLSEHEVARIDSMVLEHPRLLHAELTACVMLREATYRIFAARANARPAADDDLAIITASLNEAVAHIEWSLVHGSLRPHLARDVGIAAPRLHAALSAMALLTSERKVRQCADDRGCGWLFVDSTRNGSRRFCFSAECGNRARQAAFRRRHRGKNPAADTNQGDAELL